ncbi:Similar to hypothetical protein [Tuber melanosporum Mel28]; acc. no. XP_002836656 [Pyronema omphalodes CBS 100304]|uniref:DH domain-containing protein n=1 Tax=Pyronema omphalodes (strain CBS 100304) TaxID=1076935 RepID=U4LPX8_PYROM|nr:Similar to hypothetical protein [Tuber melanosporum Mel28]; acc. no. XP_002836656 [Pyronema omphalodes CBS 100304]
MVPPPQQKSATKEPISVQARARLFEQVQEPTPAPSHKKSSSLSISSSVDDIDLKREKLHASSFSSDKPAYPKSALKSKEAPGVTRRRSKSTPPDSRILRRGSFSKILDSFDAPVQKKEPNLVPKLTSATSTFFKAIKEGFKGESVRSIGIVSTIPHSAKDDHHSMTESMIDSELQSRDTEEELSSVEEAPKKKKTVGFIEVEHSSTEEDDEEEDEESDSEASSDSESNAGVSDKDTERESEFLSEDGSLHSDDEGDISKDSIEPPVDLPIVEPLRITPRGSPVPGFKAMNTEAAKPLTEIPIIPPSKPLAISSSDKVTKDTPKPSSETPVTKAVEEPSKQTSNAISTPEPTASRKISPIELPKPSPKDSSVEPSTPFPRPLSIPPLKTKIVEPLKTPTKKAAMGTVEEPPKRSVKDLVRQLESKPDKTAKVPPPEPLLDLLKEPVRVPDESPKSRDLEKSSSESSRDKPIQQSQKAEDVQKEPTKGVLEKSVQPSNTQDSVDTSLSDDIDETTESAEESVLSAESIPTTIEKSTHHISPDTSPNKELIGESPTARKENRIEDTNSEEILQDTAPKLSEIPALPFPKRSLRGTTAPPRPKSIRSDGTLSPPGSVCGESIDGEPFSRSISDASMVKPLQFKKAVKPATEDTVPPLSPTKEAGAQDWFNPNVPVKESSLKRRYTKHADLMSILSVPKSERTASRSRRSKGLKRVETLSVDDLLRGFAYEEVKYLRELRTLVEDVVPILFQTVLGRADDDLRRSSSISSVGTSHTGSTRSSRAFSSNPTRPIVDMGISLERLRTLHERIPTGTVEQVLAWAVDARRVYEEYLSVWRLGFQDVVVLMTPDEEDYAQARRDSLIRKELEILHAGGTGSLQFEGDPSTWAMPPPPAMDDELKDEKVDVAFLLKRPLVRLKLLAKLFKRIDYIQASPAAASLSTSFHSLVTMARRKISEEKARIEDEAAASLDVSRVYDFYTLLPRQNVSLDQNRRVKARDCFTMRLYHSSDDVIERSVELILRDPSPRHKYGDAEVLFAEVGENATKWLLFPPVPLANVSARTGDTAGEIVVMVRGLDQESREWREVMALASSTAAGFEWVQMLGLTPIPPEGPFSKEPREPAILETVIEESVVSSRVYVPAPPRKQRTTKETTKKTDISVFEYLEASDEEDIEEDTSFVLPPGWLPPNFSAAPVKPSEEFGFMGGHFEVAHISFRAEPPIERSGTRSPSLHSINDIEDAESRSSSIRRSRKASKPHRRIKSQSSHHSAEGLDDPEHPLHRTASVHLDDKERPSKEGQSLKVKNAMDNIPDLSPSSLPGPARDDSDSDSDSGSDSPPPVPPHRSATKSKHGHSKAAPVTTTGKGAKRRTSSPLKHEYDPSSPSNSESEHYERHGAHGEDDRSSSGSSSEEDSDDAVSLCSEEEDGDYPPPLLSIPRRISRQPSSSIVSIPRTRPLESNDVDSQGTLTPGMRTPIVPPHPELPPPPIPIPQIGHKFRASIFVWAVKQWETVPPGDCMIVITPGRLEAYPWTPSAPATPTAATTPNDKSLASAGSYDSLKSQEELLFAFDLAATLKIRQGTAVDINIKTPPTSRFGGENIMMRCRSQNECEILWNTVNCNRIYPQVQLPPSTIITSSSVTLPSEMSNASSTNISIKRGFGAWARSKTYRAGANGTMSTPSLVSTPSEASATSTGSAFSRFKTNIFGKNKGSMASSSSMDGSSRSGSPTGLPNVPGIENSLVVMTPMKIRFYRRENPSKWQDIGNARLIVLKPLDGQRARNQGEDEKRVVIVNKKGTTVHLDVILGESAFERVARTGIAISILTGEGEEDGTGKPGDTGGLGAKNTVYMMNMKSDAEAAFTFSILGKLRY